MQPLNQYDIQAVSGGSALAWYFTKEIAVASIMLYPTESNKKTHISLVIVVAYLSLIVCYFFGIPFN